MRSQGKRIAALGLVVLALAGCAETPAPQQAVSVPTVIARTATPAIAEVTYTVQRGEVSEVLRLGGRVTAAVDQDVFFPSEGYIKTLHVQRNEVVKKGQILAELDPGTVPTQLQQAKDDLAALQRMIDSTRQRRNIAVASAQISVQSARDNLNRAQRPASEIDVANAQADIDTARIQLEDTRNRASAAKVQAESDVQQAANDLRDRQDAYSRVLWANGNRPVDQLNDDERMRQEQAQRAVQAAEDALRLARVSYDLAVKNEINAVALGEDRIKTAERKLAQLKAGPDPADVRAAERAVQSAQLNLQSAVAVSDDSEMVARQEQIKRTIAELDDKATSGKIYAPFDGMVAELGVKPGDRVEAYAPVVNIIDPSRLTLTVTDIATADLARIRPGQVVQIVFARYPGHIVPSTIDQLPADQTSAGSQVRGNSFLRVAFPQGDMKLDLGDTADVTITFSKEPNALWLPPQALRSFDQRTFVVIKDGTQQRQVDIKTGITTADRVQILEGVNEGDVVVGVSAGS